MRIIQYHCGTKTRNYMHAYCTKRRFFLEIIYVLSKKTSKKVENLLIKM